MTKPMKAARERPYSREEVGQIVQSVMSGMGTEADMRQKMRGELESLRESIDDMRAELAQMRAADIGHKHIPAAADELDAVLGETASATGVIMDACEKIEALAGDLDSGPRDALAAIVASVYEACSFQDITGQRITKVVKTLKNIERRVEDILEACPPALPAGKEGRAGPGPGISQADIDKLLADFEL